MGNHWSPDSVWATSVRALHGSNASKLVPFAILIPNHSVVRAFRSLFVERAYLAVVCVYSQTVAACNGLRGLSRSDVWSVVTDRFRGS